MSKSMEKKQEYLIKKQKQKKIKISKTKMKLKRKKNFYIFF